MENVIQIFSDLQNQQSMEQALDWYGERLMRFINCYVRDLYQAEDLMMEVFVGLLVRKPVFEHEYQVQAYLYRTAKNKAINYLRKRKRLVTLNDQILQDLSALENTLYRSALDKKLHQAMAKINPKYQQILTLSYFDGFKNAEIAQVLAVNEKAVVNLKHRAKKKLNQVLRKENFVFDYKEEQ
ncbi:MAG: sigma-70 family RNA polymerase sigma factor [Prevotella sp.]|nr:sigma-70 family RNA polymerase sigma factor [Prevotella sp.]